MIAIALFAGLLAEPAYEQALRDFQQNRYAEAESKLRLVNPRTFSVQFLLGATLVHLGKSEEAVAELWVAHRLQPRHPDALKLLAAELLRLQRPRDVIALQPKLESLSRDEEAHLLLLQAYQDRGDSGDIEKGLALARRALARFPKSAQLHAWMGYELRETGQLADARKYLEQSLRLNPVDEFPRLILADVLLRQGHHEEAMHRFQALTATGNPEARAGLARALAGLDRIDEAIAELEKAVQKAPEQAQFHLELSRLYARAGRSEEARREAEIFRTLRRQP